MNAFDLHCNEQPNDWYPGFAQKKSSGLRREMCSSGPKMWRQSMPMTQTMLMVFGGKCVPQVQEWLRQCSRSSAGNVFLRSKNGSDNAPGLRRETLSSGIGLVIQFSLEHMRRLLAVRNFQTRNGSWFLRIDLHLRHNLPYWSQWSQILFWLLC